MVFDGVSVTLILDQLNFVLVHAHALWKHCIVKAGEVQTTVDEELKMQEDDVKAGGDLFEKAYICLTEESYPENCTGNEKRAIRHEATTFCIAQW